MIDFLQRLQQLRMDRYLTQAQVTERVGITAGMVTSYKTYIRLPFFEDRGTYN